MIRHIDGKVIYFYIQKYSMFWRDKMKKSAIFILLSVLIIVGCQKQTESSGDNKNNTNEIVHNNKSTTELIYSSKWDGNPIIVTQSNDKIINEISEREDIEKLIHLLKQANWQENVQIDIRPPDLTFAWNSYEHGVWINKTNLELMIFGQSNFGSLSEEDSTIVYQLLTNKSLDEKNES